MNASRKWRRRALFAAVLSLALVTAACTSSDDKTTPDEAGTLVFVSPGGSYAAAAFAAYLQPFENETGIQIEQVEGGDDPVAAVRAQVESGNVQWDVAACGPSIVLANPDLWEPIDDSIVKTPPDIVYPGVVGEQYVVNDIEAFPMFAYRTDVFEANPPGSWADFYDTVGFPGPRGVPNVGLDSAWFVPASALLADGVAVDDLLPLDLDRAYQKLDELKPDIRVFWTSFSQSQDIIRSSEVVMNMMTDGRSGTLVAAGEPVGQVLNQAFRTSGSWCVVKGSPNKENGMKFLNYVLSHPDQQAVFTSLTFYGPPTQAGADAAVALGVADFSSLHMDELIPDSPELLEYIGTNSEELLDRWNAWVGA